MTDLTTVFLSSTAKDLQPYRDAVYEAIHELAGHHCMRMEDFGAVDAAALETCRTRVAGADVFVGLVGHLHGSRPAGSALSYTEHEYEEARRRKKPRLLFLAAESFPVPFNLLEPEEARERQRSFRERLGKERVVATFVDHPQKLATQVATALQTLQAETARKAAGPVLAPRRSKSPARRKPELGEIEMAYLELDVAPRRLDQAR